MSGHLYGLVARLPWRPRLAGPVLVLLGLGLALGAGLGGCGAAPNTIDVSSYPPEMQRKYQIFEVRCSRCHGLERPITARVADGGWLNYVRRMSRHPGAGISSADQREIAAFLEYHHSRPAAGEEGLR